MADPSPADDGKGQEPEPVEGQAPAGEVVPVEGQEPDEKGRTYSEAYVKQLRTEAAERRTQVAHLEERLQELEDADKSEQEKLVEKLARREKRLADAEAKLLRYEVAAEVGLDPKAADFLTGSTREEVEHRAAELGKLLESTMTKPKPAAGFDGGARPRAPESRSPEEAHNDFLLEALGKEPTRRAS